MQKELLELFFVTSQWMLTPVMLILTLASMWCIVLCGQTVREYLERLRRGKSWHDYLRALRSGEAIASQWSTFAAFDLHRWLAGQTTELHALKLLLPATELRVQNQLGPLLILIRIGPMLGLIGTLIPLGPALQGLSKSSLVELGNNLGIAFTTTVFGIAIGAFAYALYVIHRHWAESDLTDIEFVLASFENRPYCEKEHGSMGKEVQDDEAHKALEARAG